MAFFNHGNKVRDLLNSRIIRCLLIDLQIFKVYSAQLNYLSWIHSSRNTNGSPTFSYIATFSNRVFQFSNS